MDAEKFIQELIDGPLGDLIRERFVEGLISDLEVDSYHPSMSQEEIEAEKAWAAYTVEWLRENYI